MPADRLRPGMTRQTSFRKIFSYSGKKIEQEKTYFSEKKFFSCFLAFVLLIEVMVK